MIENEGEFTIYGIHPYTQYHQDHDLNDPKGLVEYAPARFHPRYPRSRLNRLHQGQDTKETWLEYCRPQCDDVFNKYKTCENAYKVVSQKSADYSCVYRYRNWVECMEGCVQPKIFYHLKGASRRGPLDFLKVGGPNGMH